MDKVCLRVRTRINHHENQVTIHQSNDWNFSIRETGILEKYKQLLYRRLFIEMWRAK